MSSGLRNPFIPSEIASHPEDFFGRREELDTLARSLETSSVAIQGPIGIGKSSLMARGLMLMEGFDSAYKCRSVVAVGDRDVTTVDAAACVLLESFLEIDEKQTRVKFKLGNVFERESAEICRNFASGRHLANLKRVVENDTITQLLDGRRYLLLAVDEADKCPIPLARLVRSIATHTQQKG
ncbi:MAG: ATP-binding protein, partial [Rhodothermales bacterium]